MAVWKKVIVSGSRAELSDVTASGHYVKPGQVLGDNTLTGTIITGSFSGSFAGSLTSAQTASSINTTTAGNSNLTFYIPFVSSSTGTNGSTLYVDAGIKYNPSTDSLTIDGDLTVNGTTTYINTTDLLVEDKFIILASGSTTGAAGGIIIQSGSGATPSGFAYFLDILPSPANSTPRWGFSSSVAYNAGDSQRGYEYAVTVRSSSGTWTTTGTAPTYGGSGAGFGNMVVDGNSDIWIYA